MGQRIFLGIDIGGTKISGLVTDEKGKILGRAKKKSRAEKGEDTVLKRAEDVGREAAQVANVPWQDIAVVGVGAPSPILPDGTAVNAPNMGWKNFPLSKSLSRAFDKPVYAENDCNAGTFGEFILGGHKKARTLIGMFMGTGLGGGIVKDGKLITGENHMGGEVGHMTIHMGGRPCACGKEGCVEAYASKKGMGYAFKKAILLDGRTSILTELLEGSGYDNVRSALLKKAWDAKDEVTRETLTDAATHLGAAVGNLITLLGPNVVVLGGGVMDSLGDELLPLVQKAALRHTFPPRSANDTSLELASLGDDAVALGAMAYARSRWDSAKS